MIDPNDESTIRIYCTNNRCDYKEPLEFDTYIDHDDYGRKLYETFCPNCGKSDWVSFEELKQRTGKGE